MNISEFVDFVKRLTDNTVQSQKDIMDNYSLGLISFREYMEKMDIVADRYDEEINSAAMATANQARVSIDYLRGWCAHESVTF